MTERIQRRTVATATPPAAAAVGSSPDAAAPRWSDPALAIGVSYLDSIVAPVQRQGDGEAGDDVHALAAEGTAGAGEPLPFLDRIQASFGDHDVGGVVAHTDGAAAQAAAGMGASAFATGNHVAFGGAPDLHTAAHEAAHVIQQRAGVHLKGGVGEVGDVYERQADAVADRVVAGQSAADLLGPVRDTGRQRGAVQLDAKAGAPAPKANIIPMSQAGPLLVPGEQALLALRQARELGEAAYRIMMLQANARSLHGKIEKDYEKAKKARDKALEKSTIAKVIEAVTAIASIATGIVGLLNAANALHAAQSSLRDAKGTVKSMKDVPHTGIVVGEAKHRGEEAKKARGKAVGEGAEAGGKVGEGAGKLKDSKPDTILSDANAAAIKAGNEAADALMEEHSKLQLLMIGHHGQHAELGVAQMNRAVSALKDEGKALPAELDTQHVKLLADLKKGQAEFEAVMFKLKALWVAYADHGHDALQNAHESPIFETVMEWKRTGDPRLKTIQIAMDQNMKTIKFTDVHTHVGGDSQRIRETKCYAYTEQMEQMDRGLLYISDPAVARALNLHAAAPAMPYGPGMAESHVDEHDKGATKYMVSLSLCKALESLGGFGGQVTKASVELTAGSGTMSIRERHRSDAFEHWKDTDTFGQFWRKHLGGTYGYIKKMTGTGKLETFAAATDTHRARSVTTSENPGRKHHGEV